MADLVKPPAVEIADTRAGAAARTGGAAIGRQTANAGFQMDCYQIGHHQRPIQRLLGHSHLPGIDNHRDGRSHALIAAAGVDYNGQLTAAHSRIGACRRPGLGPVLNAVAIGFQQNLADGRAIAAVHSRLGNGHIVVDLPLEDLLHIGNLHLVGKLNDMRHIQQLPVLRCLHHIVLKGHIHQHGIILLHTHHIGMVADDPGIGAFLSMIGRHLNVKGAVGGGFRDLNLHLLQIFVQLLQLLLGDAGDDLQLLIRITAANAHRHSDLQALPPAGMGHNHGLYVLDDIAADAEDHPLRQRAQRLSRQCTGIGHRNGFGAAHSRDQLLFQDIYIGVINVFLHGFPLPYSWIALS